MLNTKSIMAESPDPGVVSKKWVYAFFGVYFIFLVLIILFVVFYSQSAATRNETQTSLDEYTSLNDQLAADNAKLSTNKQAALELNKKLNQSLSEMQTNYNALLANYTSKSAELSSAKSTLSSLKTWLLVSYIGGGISLAGNGFLIPYTIITNNKVTSTQTMVDYLLLRFGLGIAPTMEWEKLRRTSGKQKINYRLVFNSSVSMDATIFKQNLTAITGNSVVLYVTSSNEIFGFAMHEKWDFTKDEINDPYSFTFSLRHYATAAAIAGKASVKPKTEFLTIGDSEIILKSDLSVTATAGKSYTMEKTGIDASDFYLSGGTGTIQLLLVCSWWLS